MQGNNGKHCSDTGETDEEIQLHGAVVRHLETQL